MFHMNSKHSCKITSNKEQAFNVEQEMKNKTSTENSLLKNVNSLPEFSSCIFFKALLPHNFRMLNYLAPLCPNLTTLCKCHVELWQSSLQWHNFQLSCSQAKRRETDGHAWTAWGTKESRLKKERNKSKEVLWNVDKEHVWMKDGHCKTLQFTSCSFSSCSVNKLSRITWNLCRSA